MRKRFNDRQFPMMLVSYGNAYLAYRDQRTLDMAAANMAPEDVRRGIWFRRVNQREFKRSNPSFTRIASGSDDIVAETVEEWFQWLAREGFTRLYCVERFRQKTDPDWHDNDRVNSDVGNCVQADGADGRRELWHPNWDYGKSIALYYDCWTTRHDNRLPSDLMQERRYLALYVHNAASIAESLSERDFARGTNERHESELAQYREALRLLRKRSARDLPPNPLLPERGYSNQARLLLAAVDAVCRGGCWDESGSQLVYAIRRRAGFCTPG